MRGDNGSVAQAGINSRGMSLVGSLAGTLLAGMAWLTSSSCNVVSFDVPGALPPNFHVVDDGRLYRSGQPAPEHIRTVVEHYGIRTIINLRGPNAGKPWYDAEARTTKELGITQIDYPFSAQSLPPGDLLAAVEESLRTAEYPVLIHCESGADRSGMIAAVYRILILGHDRSAALQELTPEYLHFRAFRPCMATLVELYEPTPEWLADYTARRDEIPCTP